MKLTFFEVQDWEEEALKKSFPNAVFVHEALSANNTLSHSEAEIICTFINSSLKKDVLDKFPKLNCIITRSTGFDHIDIDEAKKRNIVVCNVPEYGTRTVAEHTFGLILTLTRKIYQSINQAKQFDFTHERLRGIDLNEKILGIIGLGKIGLEVLKIGKAFGMNPVVYTRTINQELAEKYKFHYLSLDELLKKSDVITLHIPYTKETHHLINTSNITTVKQGAYLINTARGGLISSEALTVGLTEKILAGVGLDVLEEEQDLSEESDVLASSSMRMDQFRTLVANQMLLRHPDVVFTPHNAFNSKEALERITQTTIENIKSFLEGKPINTL